MQTTNHRPPDIRPAERHLLAGCLHWNHAIDDAAQLIRPEDFTTHAHYLLFAAMLALRTRGEAVDLVGLAEYLHSRGQTEDVPYTMLSDLWFAEVTGADVPRHAATIRDRALRKAVADACRETLQDCEQPTGPADELLATAEQRFFALSLTGKTSQAVPLGRAADEACDAIEARGQGGLSGVPTGFLDLDALLCGLRPSELVIVAARPACGKTSMGLGIALHAGRCGVPTFFVSLEQSRVELAERLLSARSGVNSHVLRRGTLSPGERDALTAARSELQAVPLEIDDGPIQTAQRIASQARRLASRHGLGLVVLDYLQLVEPENRRENRQEQVAGVSRRLKQLSRELHAPVVALAQIGRSAEDRAGGRPKLSDLRESGAIEADADVVILLHRPDEQEPVVEAHVAKNRNGPTGGVRLYFRKELTRFEDLAKESL